MTDLKMRLIMMHDFKSKVHGVWLIIIGRAVGVAEVIPDSEFYVAPQGG